MKKIEKFNKIISIFDEINAILKETNEKIQAVQNGNN